MSAPVMDLEALRAEMYRLAERRYAGESLKAYRKGWQRFTDWCLANGLNPLPATGETVALWITSLTLAIEEAGGDRYLSPNTVRTWLASIPWMHVEQREDLPDLKMAHLVLASYHRARSDAGWKERRVDTFSKGDLVAYRDAIDFSKPIGVRDWAVTMLAIALMARRSELTCLDIEDLALEKDDDGLQWLLVRICSSKTDQAGRQAIVKIPRGQDHTMCPVSAVLAWVSWLAMQGVESGPLILSLQREGTKLTINGEAKSEEARKGRLTGDGLSRMLKRRAKRAGLLDLDIAGHSGRATGVSLSYLGGAGMAEIGEHGRWAVGSAALHRYVRNLDMKIMNPMKKVF